MIRMLLLLCAGLFLTLQIGGQDRGQMRFGLLEATRAPARVAMPVAKAAEPAEVVVAPRIAVPVSEPAAATEIVPVAYGTSQPVMVQAAPDDGVEDAVRYVTGQSVNVRSGPSTQDAVLGRLTRGEAVTVVWVEDNGWARVQVEGDGIDGYMSLSFLSERAP